MLDTSNLRANPIEALWGSENWELTIYVIAGITRAGLYKALSPDGNPSFETVTQIVGAFGMRLSAQAA
jgi:hypothetical protein